MTDEPTNGIHSDEIQEAGVLPGEVVEENEANMAVQETDGALPADAEEDPDDGSMKKKRRDEKKRQKREEKKAERAEERALIRSEIRDGLGRFKGSKGRFFPWLGTCMLLALVSLFFTTWTTGGNSGSYMMIFNLTTRMSSLFLLTLFGIFTPYKKSVFAGGTALWAVWMLLLSDVSFWWIIAVALIGSGLFAFALVYEIKKNKAGIEPKPFAQETRDWVFFFYFSVILALALELLHSFRAKMPFFNLGAPFVLFAANPDKFMNNVMAIFLTGIWTRICRRRKFATVVFSLIWLVLAFGSLLKINNVYEPLMLLDIFATIDMAAVVTKYFSLFFFIGIALAAVLIIALLIWLIKKEKLKHVRGTNYVIAGILAVITLISFIMSAMLPYAAFTDKRVIVNYSNQGFAASFARTFVGWVNPRPENYTEQEYDEIVAYVNRNYVNKTDLGVKNIIAIQLESFSDPYFYAEVNPEIKLEKDPIPYLRSLQETCSTGIVTVPVYGGMTVKSEFEFMTGIDLGNLPKGLNPYVTTIRDLKINSLPRYLTSKGFTATGIHNYQGEFFSRMYVYDSLGFDRFVPMETMNGIKRRNDDLWANDSVLPEYIERALDENKDGRNYIFVSTVQLHGSYPVITEDEFPMKIEGLPEGSTIEGQFQYYVGQLMEFDESIKAIIEMIEARNEPTVVVMYADHLPGIAKELCELSDDQIFQTRYYIWSNLENFEKIDKDMPLYRLSTEVLNRIGLDGDFINRFHEVYGSGDRDEYKRASAVVDYKLAFEGEGIYDDGEPLVFGFDTQKILSVTEEASEDDDSFHVYRVKAENVTDNTVITVNGKVYSLVRRSADEALFYTGNTPLKKGDVLTLQVIGERIGFVYLESEAYVFE